ncbi:MAG: hypothetical protein P8Y44_00875 [Acidobacteriota bacterium]
MSSGFDEAQSQRNWLERLGEKIPGYRGFQDRELRREVDKLQREHLATEVLALKGMARDMAQRFTDAGQIGVLDLFDRLDRKLDGLSQAIRFSDYGATGIFDAVKVREKELRSLYEFDLSLIEDLEMMESHIRDIPSAGEGDPRSQLERAINGVSNLEDKWSSREVAIGDIVERAHS